MSETDAKRTWPISARLKQARAAAQPKLSQSDLARRVQEAGLSYFQNGKASRLESGYAYATWVEVEAIARVLKVEPYWLANREKTAVVPKPEGMAKAATATAPAAAPAPATAAAAPAPAAPAPTPAPTPVVVAPQPVPPPAGLAAVASLLAASAPTPPAPPPPVDLPPLPLPARGSQSVLDYRSLLGVERRKAEAAMAQKGLPAAEWRRWRDYGRSINDVLRSLN